MTLTVLATGAATTGGLQAWSRQAATNSSRTGGDEQRRASGRQRLYTRSIDFNYVAAA